MEDHGAAAAGCFGQFLFELVQDALAFGARNAEVVAHGAVERDSSAAGAQHHGGPQREDPPAAPVSQPAQVIKQGCHRCQPF